MRCDRNSGRERNGSRRWSRGLRQALAGAPTCATALALALGFAPGCGGDDGQTSATSPSTETEASTSPSGSTSTTSTTSETTAGPTTDPSSTSTSGGSGNMCSLLEQDCPEGEKCVAWNENGGIFPDGVKCVPQPPGADEIGDECLTMGGFGSGEDTCVAGALCLDLDDDGMATCVAYCSGTSPEDAFCQQPNHTCVELFEPVVPLCFEKCNPLLQDCPDGEGCFMDAPMLGSAGFVCMPLIDNLEGGEFLSGCVAMSNCAPGNSCVFAENVPNCPWQYCCTPWCNLDTPEDCLMWDETLSCIEWFAEGQAPPGFEKVGICGILP